MGRNNPKRGKMPVGQPAGREKQFDGMLFECEYLGQLKGLRRTLWSRPISDLGRNALRSKRPKRFFPLGRYTADVRSSNQHRTL